MVTSELTKGQILIPRRMVTAMAVKIPALIMKSVRMLRRRHVHYFSDLQQHMGFYHYERYTIRQMD